MPDVARELSPRRRRTREKRLDAIVAAALEIVEAGSLDALTMSRLAEAVDLTPGALYRYFPSKDALVAALEARTIGRIAALLEGQRAQWLDHLPPDPKLESLCELVATAGFYIDLAEREPRTFRLVAATLGDPRPLVDDASASVVVAPLRDVIVRVSALFQTAEQRGALTPGTPPLRTIVFWTSLHGVVSTKKLDRLTEGAGWFAVDRLAGELTRALLSGWGASPALVEAAHAWQRDRVTHHPPHWEIHES